VPSALTHDGALPSGIGSKIVYVKARVEREASGSRTGGGAEPGAEPIEHMPLLVPEDSHAVHRGCEHRASISRICAAVGCVLGGAEFIAAKLAWKEGLAHRQSHMDGSNVGLLAEIMRWHAGMQYRLRKCSVIGGFVAPKIWLA
jgi:hypothetical protein